MKHKILIGALLALLGVGGLTLPTYATDIQPRTTEGEPVTTSEEDKVIPPTFVEKELQDDLTSLTFGRNLLLAGNVYDSDVTVQGLLFSAGNVMDFDSRSEYAFIAGNSIDISSAVEKDLFVAGNTITIKNDARIGRDIFAAGNVITVNADLKGDLSAGASRVVLNGINIKGNLNIDAETVVIEGKVNVDGKFIVNSDADIRGMESISYAELEKYENIDYDLTATDIMVSAIIGIVGMFIAFVITLAVFPGINKKVEKELTSLQFGKDLIVGICTLVFIPIICIFLVISLIGAVAGIVLLLAYIIMLILAQGFAGFWLGKLIMEKGFHSEMNPFLEALVGIILVQVLGLIPYVGGYVSLVTVVLGLGLIMQCLRTRGKKINSGISEAEVVTEEVVEETKPSKKTTTKTTKKTEE